MPPEGERAAALLRFANFRKVGDALGVSRSQVAQWAQGRQVTPYRLLQLEELLAQREPIGVKLDAIQSVLDGVATEQAGVVAGLGEVLRRLAPPDDDPVDGPALPQPAQLSGR